MQVAQRLKEKYKCLPPQVTERSHLALPPAFAQLAMGKQYDLVIGVMISDDLHGLISRAGPYYEEHGRRILTVVPAAEGLGLGWRCWLVRAVIKTSIGRSIGCITFPHG